MIMDLFAFIIKLFKKDVPPCKDKEKEPERIIREERSDLKLRLFVSYRQENAKDAAISAVTLSASLMKDIFL
jgi:hypothetical protein